MFKFIINAVSLLALLLTSAIVSAQPNIVWLRPLESGGERDGATITGGEHYRVMRFLAEQIPSFKHRFESYPIKRNWRLIQTASDETTGYCFFGAGYNPEREEWGIYSSPTAIGLPYLIAAPTGLLSLFENNGTVFLEHLLRNGYKTVLYGQVSNMWVAQIEQYDFPNSVLRISGIDTELNKHTLQLIDKRRIDFGYVAHKELALLSPEQLSRLSLYQVREFSQQVRQTKRVLCSRSTLGVQAVEQIDAALGQIRTDEHKNRQFMQLNFAADGYAVSTKALYEKLWVQEFN